MKKTELGQSLIRSLREIVDDKFEGKECLWYYPKVDMLVVDNYEPRLVLVDPDHGLYHKRWIVESYTPGGENRIEIADFYLIGEL